MTHYPNRFERQGMRARGYLRTCSRCGQLQPVLGGTIVKTVFRCADCKRKPSQGVSPKPK